jgi:hypothetical protein
MSCDSCTIPSDAIIYSGPNLLCIDVDRRESTTVAIQKAEQTVCELQTAVNILQQQVNALVPTTTIYPTTSTTTTAPGLVYIMNNSVNVTVNNMWTLQFIPGGTDVYYYAVYYSGNNFPLAPGQSGYFTIPGSNPSAIYHQIDYSANSGGATCTGTCPGTGNTANLLSGGGVTAVLIGCNGLPISPGEVRSFTINQ